MRAQSENKQTGQRVGKLVTETWLVSILRLIGWAGYASFPDQSQIEV